MDMYQVHPDPWDNRIIRFNNFIQLLSCICSLLAICIDGLEQAAEILRLIAQIVFYTTAGCMSAQMIYELNYQDEIAPKAATMER